MTAATATPLIEDLREDLYKLFEADDRSIPEICEAAGVDNANVYRFLKRSRDNLHVTTVLSLAEAMGYRVTFEKLES